MRIDENTAVFGNAKFEDVVVFVNEVERIRAGEPARENVQQKRVMRCIVRLADSLMGVDSSVANTVNPLISYRRGSLPTVTQLGDQLYDEAVRLVELLTKWRRLVRQQSRGVKLRIGFRSYHWKWLVQPWTQKILENSQGQVLMDFVSNYPGELEQMMLARQLHFCLIYDGFRDIPGYRRTKVAEQSLYLAAHIPERVKRKPETIQEVIESDYAFVIEMNRDATSYAAQYRNHHEDNPFFFMPKHRFTDTNVGWGFFRGKVGEGAVGYFSERKLRKAGKNIVVFPDFTIKRPTFLYSQVFAEDRVLEGHTRIFDKLSKGQANGSAFSRDEMQCLINACEACWPRNA